MSEFSSFEMGSVDKPPNRFQVNPVNHKNNNDKAANAAATPGGGSDDAPHEVYRRLTGLDGEPIEDDQFNEDASQMIKAQPRQQR